MKAWLLRILDRAILIARAFQARRESLARMADELDRLREQHRRELEGLESQLALKDREIKHLLAINARDLERVERETAIASAGRQQAALEVARAPR